MRPERRLCATVRGALMLRRAKRLARIDQRASELLVQRGRVGRDVEIAEFDLGDGP